MAQHISIINSEIKGFQKVAESFCKKANQGIWAIAGSLKFEEIRHNDFKINSTDRVFTTQRVVNRNKETFELHYDTNTQKLLDIFLVK